MIKAYLSALAKRVATDPSAMGLLACNIAAVAIAVFRPPISVAVLVLYWAECAIIGLFAIVKFGFAQILQLPEAERTVPGALKQTASTIVVPLFFLAHYGGFVLAGYAMTRDITGFEMRGRGVLDYELSEHLAAYMFSALPIVAGHAISFYRNFLGKREYERQDLMDLMVRPYLRVLPLIVVGAAAIILIKITHLPEAALLLIVPIKIIGDLEMHFRSHAVKLSPSEQ